MKGDFSRRTFDPARHYSGVLAQQGRVTLDADWNEAVEIDHHRDRVEALDTIGVNGAPKADAGFEITLTAGALLIGPGRFYAGGLLCENEAFVAYDAQPGYPGAPPPSDAVGDAPFALAVLDAWERHVTALEDPGFLYYAMLVLLYFFCLPVMPPILMLLLIGTLVYSRLHLYIFYYC